MIRSVVFCNNRLTMLHHYLAKDVGRLFVCSFVSVIRRNVANSAAVPATKDAIRYLGCDGENMTFQRVFCSLPRQPRSSPSCCCSSEKNSPTDCTTKSCSKMWLWSIDEDLRTAILFSMENGCSGLVSKPCIGYALNRLTAVWGLLLRLC